MQWIIITVNLFELRTNLFKSFYLGPLPGFCIDYVRCSNEQLFVDDPESDDYNIDKLVSNFVNTATSYAKTYSTNNLLVTQG